MKLNEYQIVSESLSSIILYHGSPFQNIKIIQPRRESYNKEGDKVRIAATDSAMWASTFTYRYKGFPKLDSHGRPTDLSWRRITSNGVISIPRKFRKLMVKPCSLYVVKGKFVKDKDYNEYSSYEPASVVREFKYPNPVVAMIENGWKIEWVK